MNQRVENVKVHLKANKKIYIATGIGVAVGIAVGVFGTRFLFKHADSEAQIVQKITPILSWRPESTNVVIEMIERSTPSKPVHLIGTERYFDSIHDAARKTGHHVSMISKNVNGHIPDLNGDVFEVIKPAA